MSFTSFGQTMQVYAPSGDPSGATDRAAINGFFFNNDPVQLTGNSRTPYFVDKRLLANTWPLKLWGSQWYSASQQDSYGAGTGNAGGSLIIAVPGFTPSAADHPGIIEIINTTGVQWYGYDFAGFTIEGNQILNSTVHGIVVEGAVGAGFMRGVMVHRPQQDCFHMEAGASTFVPDEWVIDQCKGSGSRNGIGLYAPQLPDSIISNSNFSENFGTGCVTAFCTNTKLIGTKGENNGGNGFSFAGFTAGEYIEFIGCTTNFNQLDGFSFNNSAGGAQGNVNLVGCRSTNDGQSGGATNSGFHDNGCLSRVMMTGCYALGAKYGARAEGVAFGMALTGCSMSGTTAPTFDSGTNTHALSNLAAVPF